MTWIEGPLLLVPWLLISIPVSGPHYFTSLVSKILALSFKLNPKTN